MWDLTFDDMCDKLEGRENFSLARVGDGEWLCILGASGSNCDAHPYYRDLSLSLAFVLLQGQRYYMGMQPKATKDLGAQIASWIARNECDIEWCNADIIHDASIADRLEEMFFALRGRKVVLVGPPHLKPIAMRLRAPHIETPSFPAWKAWTTLYADMAEQLDGDSVVLYCSGMATEVMLDKAHDEYGDTITQIDVGSAFDPLCGVCSRKYHKQILARLKEQI